MTYSKHLFSLFLMLLIITTLSRCIALTDYEEGPLLSLDGALSFKAFVNKTDKHAPNHNLVVLTEEVQKGGQTYELETGASDTMKWAMGWYNDSTLLLQSSDIGNLIVPTQGPVIP